MNDSFPVLHQPRERNHTLAPGLAHILFLLTDGHGGHGGISQFNRDLIEGLQSSASVGSVTVVPRHIEPELGDVPDKIKYDLSGTKNIRAYLTAAGKYMLGKGRVDAVFCGHLHLVPLAASIGRLRKAPVVLFIHGIEAWEPTKRHLANRMVRSIDHVVSVSELTRKRFVEWSGFPEDRVLILHDTFHVEDVRPASGLPDLVQEYRLEGQKVLLTLGRLVGAEREKGFDRLLDVLPTLVQHDPRICYVIAGKGPDLARLQAKARKLCVSERCRFIGYVPPDRKADVLRLADAFVMASKGEGFGIVLLEAMSCGIPVVGSLKDATREALRDGELGILVDPDEPGDIVRGVLEALSRPKTVPQGLEHFSFDNFKRRVREIVDLTVPHKSNDDCAESPRNPRTSTASRRKLNPNSHATRKSTNILYLTTGCFDKGGISRFSRYEISALREIFSEKSVSVFSLLGPDGSGFETPLSIDWHGRNGNIVDKGRFSLEVIRNAIRTPPDLIHVAHTNLAPLALTVMRMTGAKGLLNVYGLEVWSGLSPLRRWAMSSMDFLLADCHFTSRYIEMENMHRLRPAVIWDCVDLGRFTPGRCSAAVRQRYGLPDKEHAFVIMSLGRLGKRAAHKGYDRLIKVFEKVKAACDNAHLVIAGQGDDRPRLEELVQSLHLTDSVTFTGAISEADLTDVYRAASVFSLVSDRGKGRGEGLPLTPLEAMSCGIPIFVGDQDGSQEAIISSPDGTKNGYVIAPFDLEQHARALLEIARSPSLLDRMSISARRVSEENFGYSRFLMQHRELYAGLLNRAR